MSVYIICPTICYEKGDWYIGSTRNKISQRYSQHKCGFFRWKKNEYGYTSLFSIFEKYGVENCDIVQLETDIPHEQLKWREKFYFEKYISINKNRVPICIGSYRQRNREKCVERDKRYYANNIEKIKEYHSINRDKINERKRIYMRNKRALEKQNI